MVHSWDPLIAATYSLQHYTIVLTQSGFDLGSQRDVQDLSFMGYFIEDLVVEP